MDPSDDEPLHLSLSDDDEEVEELVEALYFYATQPPITRRDWDQRATQWALAKHMKLLPTPHWSGSGPSQRAAYWKRFEKHLETMPRVSVVEWIVARWPDEIPTDGTGAAHTEAVLQYQPIHGLGGSYKDKKPALNPDPIWAVIESYLHLPPEDREKINHLATQWCVYQTLIPWHTFGQFPLEVRLEVNVFDWFNSAMEWARRQTPFVSKIYDWCAAYSRLTRLQQPLKAYVKLDVQARHRWDKAAVAFFYDREYATLPFPPGGTEQLDTLPPVQLARWIVVNGPTTTGGNIYLTQAEKDAAMADHYYQKMHGGTAVKQMKANPTPYLDYLEVKNIAKAVLMYAQLDAKTRNDVEKCATNDGMLCWDKKPNTKPTVRVLDWYAQMLNEGYTNPYDYYAVRVWKLRRSEDMLADTDSDDEPWQNVATAEAAEAFAAAAAAAAAAAGGENTLGDASMHLDPPSPAATGGGSAAFQDATMRDSAESFDLASPSPATSKDSSPINLDSMDDLTEPWPTDL
jgi:hypothetical protein